ncbi:hypothetical protein OROGR_028432 [Orobanche gracilis]
MPPKQSSHVTMTDKIRKELCQYKKDHPGVTQKNLQQWLEEKHHLKVTQSTISNTLRRSAELLNVDNLNESSRRKKMVTFPLMEKALAEWVQSYQSRINITGDLMKEKGAFFLTKLYPEATSFDFSNGWLERFKQRHGESGTVDMQAVEDAIPTLRNVLDKYEWKDIYNMDETGLFYRLQADNSLATKQLEGRKQNKERITVVVCTNGDGSDKFPLWVIEKYLNPRCFKHINRDNLGCQYRNNQKAWMTQNIFLGRLQAFDQHVKDRKVLLLLDNCSAHIPVGELHNHINLRNTTLHYLPPNMTSKLQPCDAGIIRNFKAYYRRRFTRKLLERLESNTPDPEKIDILEAIRMAVASWTLDVKKESIANCFLHCKIRSVSAEQEVTDNNEMESIVQELNSLIRNMRYKNPMNVNELLDFQAEQEVCYTPTEQDIVNTIISQSDKKASEVDEDDDDSQEIPKIPISSAIQMLQSIEIFLLQQDGDHKDQVKMIQKILDDVKVIRQSNLKQASIMKYFSNS